MDQGRELFAVAGTESIPGLNTQSLKTLPTALHVDTFPCPMHQSLSLHQRQASPTGKRRCQKRLGSNSTQSQRCMSMQCMHGVSLKKLLR